MKLFRSLNASDVNPNWAGSLLDNGTLPSYRGGYVGVGALKNSDVLTAVSIIASDVGRFPIVVSDRHTGDAVNLENVEYMLNSKANSRLSAYQWKFSMTVNAILSGNAYSRIIRDPLTGQASMLEFYAPSQTFVDQSDPTRLVYRFTPYNAGYEIVCQAEDVVHWKFFSLDTIMGRSPLLSLADEIGLQTAGVGTLKKFFQDGFKGSLLKAKGKLSGEARAKIRREFEEAQAGSTPGSPIITDDTIDYQPLEVDTNVLNLITSNNYSTAQIAKALHIPGYRLAQNSPNQSVKQLADDYVKNSLSYYFMPITSEAEMKLLSDEERHKYTIAFDTSAVAGMSVDDVVKLKTNGIITGDKSRTNIGLKPTGLPDMNRYESNLNTIFVDQREKYLEKSRPNTLKGGDDNDSKGKGNSDTDDAD